MILPIPIGADAERPRLPRVTIGLIALNTLVFLLTMRTDVTRIEAQEAKLERMADWTLQKAARASNAVAVLRAQHPSALALLHEEPAWRSAVGDDELRERLEGYLGEHESLTQDVPHHRWGFVPADVSAARLVSYQFLHADFLHLVGNMLFLWVVGSVLENTWGAATLLGVYLASGVAAALAHAAGHLGSTEPAIGASGSVAGLMGAFAVAHSRTPIRIALVAMISLAPRISLHSVPAWLFLGLWLVEQLFWSALTAKIDVGVAFGAHLGGFAFGVAAAAVIGVVMRSRHREAPAAA